MVRKLVLISLAAAAAAFAAQAQDSGGLSGSASSGVSGGGSGALSGRPDHPLERSNVTGVERRTPGELERRVDPRAIVAAEPYHPRHARSAGRAGRNANARVGPLASLAAGMTLRDPSGAPIGRITRVVRSADGTVRAVLVAPASGHRRTVSIAPQTVRVAGGVAMTTQRASSLGIR